MSPKEPGGDFLNGFKIEEFFSAETHPVWNSVLICAHGKPFLGRYIFVDSKVLQGQSVCQPKNFVQLEPQVIFLS
jgi:hypothetical protein